MDNNYKITGMRYEEKITGVDSENESAESGSTGAADELELIEEATAEA